MTTQLKEGMVSDVVCLALESAYFANMPTERRHRGPHPDDPKLFAVEQEALLREALVDLAWLWSREYAHPSSTRLVGDRYQLTSRQREAVGRSCCSDDALILRGKHRLPVKAIKGAELVIDGFNVLVTLEVIFSRGVLLRGRDGCLRDMASMHGGYRLIGETLPAIGVMLHALMFWRPKSVQFLFDQPVSNSGRLASAIREAIVGFGLPEATWQVGVVPDPDVVLKEKTSSLVASADSAILDSRNQWINLAEEILRWGLAREVFPHDPWLMDLG
ncbi:MAG: DUF434 domain-containing protein [Verrucomicrobiaceae bacterium]|nr:DUF434 domain-containing protein [Verrucomicrobiaceae bacterium]